MGVAAFTSAVILLVMLGVSWYGWVTLPANALVPIHSGTGYNRFVPKRFGLAMHPAAAVLVYLVYLVLLGLVNNASPNGAAATTLPDVLLPIVMITVLVVQAGAIRRARRSRAHRRSRTLTVAGFLTCHWSPSTCGCWETPGCGT